MSNLWTLILASILEHSLPRCPWTATYIMLRSLFLYIIHMEALPMIATASDCKWQIYSRGCYTALRFWNPRIRRSVPAGVPQANSVLKKNLHGVWVRHTWPNVLFYRNNAETCNSEKKGIDSYSRKTMYEICVVKTSTEACIVLEEEMSTKFILENPMETDN
jgi:hypothetical protein